MAVLLVVLLICSLCVYFAGMIGYAVLNARQQERREAATVRPHYSRPANAKQSGEPLWALAPFGATSGKRDPFFRGASSAITPPMTASSTLPAKSNPRMELDVARPPAAETPNTAPGNLPLTTPSQAPPILCPGLVVPDGCECMLLVPRIKPTEVSSEVTVDDVAGVPVFKAVFSLPPAHKRTRAQPSHASWPVLNNADEVPCLVLSSLTEDESVFASCRKGFNDTLVIHDCLERAFGSIRALSPKADGGYEVIGGAGAQLQLSSSGEDLSIIDRYGKVMALTEHAQGHPNCRVVRIGPFADAGLVTVSMLASDFLRGAAEARHQSLDHILDPLEHHFSG